MSQLINDWLNALKGADDKQLFHRLHENSAIILPDTPLIKDKTRIVKAWQNLVSEHIFKVIPYLNYHILESDTLIGKVKVINDTIYSAYFETIRPSKRLRLDLAYDGSHYRGFQRQSDSDIPTIQRTLESGLSHLLNETITVHPASRTDSGVHANHQVIHFDTANPLDTATIKRLLNNSLPNDIIIRDCTQVPQVFHARYDTIKKHYHYQFDHTDNPYKAHYAMGYPSLDIKKLNTILHTFVGTHDFAGFSKSENKASTTRTIYQAKAWQTKNHTSIEIEGNGFLRHMVRMIIGQILYDIRTGDNTVETRLKNPDKCVSKHLAPAQGLYLNKILYT